MHLFKILTLCLTLSFIHSLNADEVTKVLQNGKDGYSGCTDTHIKIKKGETGNPDEYQFLNDNYKSQEQMEIAWCPS